MQYTPLELSPSLTTSTFIELILEDQSPLYYVTGLVL